MKRNIGHSIRVSLLVSVTAIAVNAEDGDETEVQLDECPRVVQRTLKRESRGGEIVEIEREEEDGKTTYEAEMLIDGKEYEAEVTSDGTLLSKQLERQKDNRKEESENDNEEEEEVRVELSDLPKVVRKTLRREARQGEIEEIERETENGKIVFEAEVELDGKDYEIEIANDGTLLSKVLDDDIEEDDDEDDEYESNEPED